MSDNEPPAVRMLTLQRVAEILALSLAHLRREVRLRKLRAHRFGRTIRVSEVDLQVYLDAHCKPSR